MHCAFLPRTSVFNVSCLYLMCLAQAGTCNLQDGLVSYHLGSDTSVHHSFILIFFLNLSTFDVPIFRVIKTELWVESAGKLVMKILLWVMQQFHPLKFYRKVLFTGTREPKDLTHTHFLFHHNCTLASAWVSLLCFVFPSGERSLPKKGGRKTAKLLFAWV